MGLKKYFGDKHFYKMVMAISLPIILQNGITQFVSLLDNIMVGQVGTEQMSGVAIVNNLIFVFNLAVFGLISGAGIFTSQFFGKGDDEGVRKTFRYKNISIFILVILSIIVFYSFGDSLIRLYLNDGSAEGDLELTFYFAKEYLKIMIWTLPPFAFTQVYSSTLRETEHPVLPMVSGAVAVLVNCTGNYILIFGKFGAPELGVTGAAIATLASRFVELFILIVYVGIKNKEYPFIQKSYAHLFHIEKELVIRISKKGLPLFLNETLWSIGVSGLAYCYSIRGIAVVAGYNIASTVSNVFNIIYMTIGTCVGIIVGKYLGAHNFEEAVEIDRKLITFSCIVGASLGVLLALLAPLFPQIYNTTNEVKEIAKGLLFVYAACTPMNAFMNACYFTLRSGGKTLITFIYDSVMQTCVNVPVAFILATCTTLPIIPIFIIVNSLGLIKCGIGFVMLKKRLWLNQIV